LNFLESKFEKISAGVFVSRVSSGVTGAGFSFAERLGRASLIIFLFVLIKY
jgi:hypothetical protein